MKEGWEYKKIGELCEVTDYVANGSFATLRANVQYKSEKDYAILVRLADYSNDFAPNKFVYIDKHAYDFLSKSKLFGGEIIMSNVGSLGKQFICPNLGMPMSLAPNSIVIKTPYNKYFFRCFQSNAFQDKIKSISSQTALPKFNKTQFKELQIPVPPLSTQQQIVSELDLLSGIIEKQKKQLLELDNLAQSIFYQMFGDIDSNAKHYDVFTLNDVFEFIKDGTHQTPKYTEDKVDGYKFLSAKDVVSGYIDWSNIKYIPEDLHNELYKHISPKRNDILLCKNGTTGIAAIVDTDEIFDIYVSLALLRPKEGFISTYLLYAINNPYTKRQFDDSLKGVGVPNLHLGEIKKAKIIVPPIELQKEFVKKIESIDKQKQLIKSSLHETESLFNSRMDYYFN